MIIVYISTLWVTPRANLMLECLWCSDSHVVRCRIYLSNKGEDFTFIIFDEKLDNLAPGYALLYYTVLCYDILCFSFIFHDIWYSMLHTHIYICIYNIYIHCCGHWNWQLSWFITIWIFTRVYKKIYTIHTMWDVLKHNPYWLKRARPCLLNMTVQNTWNEIVIRGKNFKTWVMYKNVNKDMKSVGNSSPLYPTHTPTATWNINLKLDHHTRDKWCIHGPKYGKENQLLSLEHLCWLSSV